EGPWRALFDSLVTRTGYGGSNKIGHNYCLTALSAVAASINRLPGAGRAQGVAATSIGDSADDNNHRGAAVIGGRGRVEGPSVAALHGFIGIAANNDRRGRVNDRHRLTSRAAVPAP